MDMYNNKFWVSDLSKTALERLKRTVRRNLKNEGYSNEEINELLDDLVTSKLTDIDCAVNYNYKYLEKLADME